MTAEIEDNGCGFVASNGATANQRMRLGLLGMRERAAIARGSLTVDSEPGKGTRVLLQIPLPAANAAEQKLAEVHA